MNDKKKIAIFGALLAVLLAVGAFQFMAPPPAVVDPEGDKKPVAEGTEAAESPDGTAAPTDPKKDPLKEMLLSLATASATPRDPFVPTGDLVAEFQSAVSKVAAGDPGASQAVQMDRAPRPQAPANVEPLLPMQGSLQPVGDQGTPPAGPAAANPDEFGYKVRGVIVGNSRMVVLEDSEGNQKLVPVGASVDGDSTVVGLNGDDVVIRHRGRKKEVKLEEDRR